MEKEGGPTPTPTGPEKDGGASFRDRGLEAAAAVCDFGAEKLGNMREKLGGAAEKLGEKAHAAAEKLGAKGQEVLRSAYESSAIQVPLDHFRAWKNEKMAGFAQGVEKRSSGKRDEVENTLHTAKEDYGKIENFFKSKGIAVPAEDQRRSAERIAQLETKKQKAEQKLGTVESVRKNYEGKRMEAVERLAGRVEKKIEANNEKIGGLKAEAEKLTGEIDHRKTQLETWRTDAGELRESLASLSGQGLREKDFPQAKAMLKGLEGRIKEHEKQVQELEKDRTKIEEKITDAEKENAGYSAKIEEMRTGKKEAPEKDAADPDAEKKAEEEKAKDGEKTKGEKTEEEKLTDARERSFGELLKKRDTLDPAQYEESVRRWLQNELTHPGGSAGRAQRALETLPADRREAVRVEELEKALKSGKELQKEAIAGLIDSVEDKAKRKELHGMFAEALEQKVPGEKEKTTEKPGEKKDGEPAAEKEGAGKDVLSEEVSRKKEAATEEKQGFWKSVGAGAKGFGRTLRLLYGFLLLPIRLVEKAAVRLMKEYKGKVPRPLRDITEWAIKKSESKPEIK